ncbi:MAG TPA: hypothetical protein VGQ83_18395 [Polyangia bacterium]|jgi:hypothetical protein
MSAATKKRYRSAAERVLWLGMIDPGLSSGVDLSRVGLPARRREWRLAIFVSVALVSVVSLIWLR